MKTIQAGSSRLTKGTCIARLGLPMAIGLTAMLCATAQAAHGTYSFTKLLTLGDRAPGGGNHINDFEPGILNNRGDAVFGTDLGTSTDPATGFGEGVFLLHAGRISELARSGANAPGGGVFDVLLLGSTALNDQGDAAFAYTLSPFSFPYGVNGGMWRYSHVSHTVSAVVLPGVTPAPAGGTFAGVDFSVSLNNRGDIVFAGIVATDKGIHVPDEEYLGLGVGAFLADKRGKITSVVSPGDAAPGGGVFDFAPGGLINNGGDVLFYGHLAGEETRAEESAPQAVFINSLGSVYVREAGTGAIRSIARQGDPAPGGGVFRSAYPSMLNDRGDIAFAGDLSSAGHIYEVLAVYLHSGCVTTPVVRPGDPMPGGGTFVTASAVGGGQIHVNNAGQVAFNAVLSTDDNADGSLDTGLFVWSRGSLRLVARTGTVIPGVGTIFGLVTGANIFPPLPFITPNSGAVSNDRGQVFFCATLTDGRGVLLVATPKH